MQQLDEILQAGNFDDEFNFDFFTGVACLNLGGSVSIKRSLLYSSGKYKLSNIFSKYPKRLDFYVNF